MKEVLLNEVFELLEKARRLEKTGRHRIEAATKYYEACYVMRQILAMGAASEGQPSAPIEGNTTRTSTAYSSLRGSTSRHNSRSQCGSSCRRLLESKIEHYTKVAQNLYFDDSSMANETTAPYTERSSNNNKNNQDSHLPPTAVMIGILDDVVSVLSVPSTPLAEYPPVSSRGIPNHNRKPQSSMDACVKSPDKTQGKSIPPQYTTTTTTPPTTTKTQLPQNTLVEREIRVRMYLANSKLSHAIDLDEYLRSHERSSNASRDSDLVRYRKATIDAYIEASELYLKSIQLAINLRDKVSSRTIYTVLPKLKELLTASMDRAEALKTGNRHPIFKVSSKAQHRDPAKAAPLDFVMDSAKEGMNHMKQFWSCPRNSSANFSWIGNGGIFDPRLKDTTQKRLNVKPTQTVRRNNY